MEYRKLEKLGISTSLLGFGTMRLPVSNQNNSEIIEEEAINMIRYAIDAGVNYIDTAYMYHDGNSELVVGKALKEGYREKVFIADKMPVWMAKSEEEMHQIFETQFARLGVDCIDFYLVHNITKPIWKIANKYHLLEFLEKKRAQGKIKYIGFSFHDSKEFFKEIINAYPWDFCQIQFNYMDTEYQAGLEGLQYATSKEIPVMVMEPLKGSRLAIQPPKQVQDVWDRFNVKRKPAEWALRWLGNFPSVHVILSGMTTMEQVKENIETLSHIKPNTLSKEELDLIKEVKETYANLIKINCSECSYCMPCPSKVNIPKIFAYYNDMFLYDLNDLTLKDFNTFVPPKQRASICVECGQCQDHCPQQLPIIQLLKKTVDVLEGKG